MIIKKRKWRAKKELIVYVYNHSLVWGVNKRGNENKLQVF